VVDGARVLWLSEEYVASPTAKNCRIEEDFEVVAQFDDSVCGQLRHCNEHLET
jgi:hypothetical protein